MTLITDNDTLQKFIPNILQPVRGETALFDKIAVHLAAAEQWLSRTFTSSDTLAALAATPADDALRLAASQIIVAEALRRAVPSLDLVLTPNGFGVVQSSNITPASRQRVDRLAASMIELRDDAIAALLPLLPAAPGWLGTTQAAFFGATLFPDLSLTDQIFASKAQGDFPIPDSQLPHSKWERYLELRPQVLDLEASLAEEWFSPELMDVLRRRNLAHILADTDRHAVASIQSHILGYLRTGTFNTRRLADTLTYIRRHPDRFPEWHNSATAELFAPPKFTNKKNASCYFF